MAVCPIRGLNQSYYEKVVSYAAQVMKNGIKDKVPYSEEFLKPYIQKMYDARLKGTNGNRAASANLAGAFFSAFKHMLDYKDENGNKPYLEHATSTKFDFGKLYERTQFLEKANAQDRIYYMQDYLGIEQQLALDMANAMEIEIQNEREAQMMLKEQHRTQPPQMAAGMVVNVMDANRKTDQNFVATPETPLRTTGLENIPNTDLPDTSDPVKVLYYKSMRRIIDKVMQEDMNDSRELILPGASSGLYITFMSRDKVVREGYDQYIMADARDSAFYAVPTDKNGNILYFDKNSGENVALAEEGVPVFYAVPGVTLNKEEGKYYYSKSSTQLDRSVDAYATRYGVSPEEAKIEVQRVMAMNYAIKEKLLKDPEAKIMSYVNGGSPGYILYDLNIQTKVADIKFAEKYRLNVDQLNYHGKGKGITYLYDPKIDNYPIRVERPFLSEEILDKVSILLTQPITNSNTGKPMSYELRNSLLEQFLYKKPYSGYLIKFFPMSKDKRFQPEYNLYLENVRQDLSTPEGREAARQKVLQILTNTYRDLKVYPAKLNIQNELIDKTNIDIMDLTRSSDGNYTYAEATVDYKTFLEREGMFINYRKNEEDQLAVLNPYITFGFSPEQLEQFDQPIAVDKNSAKDYKSFLELKEEFKGKFIYSTPGTGKTEIVSNGYVDNLVDADDILADYLRNIPGVSYWNDPYSSVTNNTVGIFMESLFQQDPKTADKIYESAYKDIQQLLKKGKTVLTGSHRYAKYADHVFIQPSNVSLLEALYKKMAGKPVMPQAYNVNNVLANIRASEQKEENSSPNKVLTLDKQLYAVDSENPVLFNKKEVTEPVSIEDNTDELNKTVLSIQDLKDKYTPFKPGDEVEVYFKNSDNESELEIKEISKTKYGYRVVFNAGKGKEYTYFVDNQGKGDKIDILTEGVFEITPEMNAEINSLQEKAEQLWKMYNSVKDRQAFIQGEVPSFAISPIAETISISREMVDDQLNAFRKEPESEKGYKVVIPGHNTQFYLIESTGYIEDLKTGRRIAPSEFKKGLLQRGTNIEKGSDSERIMSDLGFDVTKLYKPGSKDDFGQGPADYVSDPDAFKSIFTKGEEVKATPEQLKAAEEWYNSSPLKKYLPFQIMTAAFNLPSDKVAAWTKQGIILSKRADMSDYYHEAFEGFVRTFMTQDQVRELIRQTRKLPGTFKDYDGNKVSFRDANFEQLVDFLAEGFRSYMLEPNKYEFNTKAEKSIFEWLKNILRILFDDATLDSLSSDPIEATASIRELYEKLRVGDLVDYSFQGTTDKKDRIATGMVAINDLNTKRDLTFNESDLAVRTMDSYISEYVDMYPLMARGKLTENERDQYLNIRDRIYQFGYDFAKLTDEEKALNKRVTDLLINKRNEDGGYTIQLIKNKEQRSRMYGYILKRLQDKLEIMKSDPDLKSIKRAPILAKKIELVEWLIAEFGDTEFKDYNVPVDEFGNIKGVIAYHMSNTDVLEAADKEELLANYNLDEDAIYTESIDGGRDLFGDGGNNLSIVERADPDVLHILKSLYQPSEKDPNIPELNELNVPKLISFDRVFNNMVRLLEGVRDRKVMFNMMLEESETFPAYRQLLSKFGDPDAKIESKNPDGTVAITYTGSRVGFGMWNKVLNVFSNTHIPLIQTTIKETTVTDQGVKLSVPKYKVTVGTASAIHKRVGDRWEKEFQDLDPTYSGYRVFILRDPETGKNYMDIDRVLKKFPPADLTDKAKPEKFIEFLNSIGIDLDDSSSIKTALRKDPNLKKSIIALRDKLSKIQTYNSTTTKEKVVLTGINDFIRREIAGSEPAISSMTTNYTKIQQLEARYSDFHSNFMVTNAELNAQYEHSLNSTLSTMVNLLDDYKNYPKYQDIIAMPKMEHLDIARNPQARRSVLLNSLFILDLPTTHPDYGKRRTKERTGEPVRIELHNLSGITLLSDDRFVKGIANAAADPQSKLLTELHNFAYLQTLELMRHSDKKTSNSVTVDNIYANGKFGPYYVDVNEFRPDRNTGFRSTAKIMSGHLAAELDRIQMFRGLTKADKSRIFYDFDYINRGKNFVLFADMPDALKENLLAIPAGVTLEQAMQGNIDLKESVMNYLMDYVKLQSKRISDRVSEAEFIDMPMNLKEQGIDRDTLINAFVANSLLHNVESLALIYGDPAMYNTKKEEFHKRNSGVGGTGIIMATDAAALRFVNSDTYNKDNYAKTVLGQTFSTRNFDGSVDTAVIEDPVVRSAYFDTLVQVKTAELKKNNPGITDEQIREKLYGSKQNKDGSVTIGTETNVLGGEMKPYNEMKVADAQGYITFDMYRMLRDLAGRWTPIQEKYYKKIVNGEPLDVSAARLAEIFPPEKYQYWGALKLDDRAKRLGLPSLTAMHKFALVPLVPTVIQGSQVLTQLHTKMMREGVGYALFKSGSKVATATRYDSATDGTLGDKVYKVDDDNKVNSFTVSEQMTNQAPMFTFVKNTIFVDFLKVQVEIAPKFKDKISLTSQLRKLIEEGMMQNGIPMDYETSLPLNERVSKWNSLTDENEKMRLSPFYTRVKAYEKGIEDLTKKRQQELIDEMGVELNRDGTIKNGIENFISFVKRELNRREIGNHAINMLGINNKGEFKVPLDLSLQADEIERMLNNIITKRIVKLQVKGEALIQVSNAMFEDRSFAFGENGRNFKKPTEDDLKKYGTIDLPYYQMYNVGEKRMVRLAKAKIAMQGDFKMLFNLNDKNGEKIAVYNSVMKDGEVKYEFDMRASLDKLNALLKDDEWLNIGDHRKMITISGPRIPVQGLNSAEALEVYEFLPEEAGPIVITPAEIVAKSGSDFDKDTLFLLMPHLYMVNGNVKMKSRKYQSKRKTNDVTNELKGLRQQREEVYKKYDDLQERAEAMKVLDLTVEEQMEMARLKRDFSQASREVNATITGLESLWLEVNKGKIAGPEAVRITNQLYNAYVQKDILRANYESNKDQYLSRKRENYEKFKNKRDAELSKLNTKIEAVTDELNANSSGAIENEIIGHFVGFVSLPENFDSLTRPNDTNIVKPLADELSRRLSKNKYDSKEWYFSESGRQSGEVAGTRIIELEYNLAKHDENNVGKQVLGIAAVDNTYNILYNRIGMHMKHFISHYSDEKIIDLMRRNEAGQKLPADEIKAIKNAKVQRIYMPHNQFTKNGLDVISLSHIYDSENKYRISDVISQLMNGWVDVAKDAWIFNLQGNKEIASTLLFMIQSGVPFKQAVYFASQPLVREYVRQQRLIKSSYGDAIPNVITPEQDNMFRNQARANVMSTYGFGTGPDGKMAFDMNQITGQNLRAQRFELEKKSDEFIQNTFEELGISQFDMGRLDGAIEQGLDQVDDHQKAAFIHFLQLEDMSKASTEFKMATNVDTTRTGSVFTTLERVIKLRKLESNKRIPAEEMLDKIETQSPISGFFIQDFQLQMARELFPIRNSEAVIEFIKEKSKLVNDDVTRLFGEGNYEDFWTAFRNNIMSFIFQNSLNWFAADSLKSYKGMAVDTDFEIVRTPALYHKAVVSKDKTTGKDILYVDLKSIQEDFEAGRWKQGYTKPAKLRPLFGKGVEYAKLDPNTFNVLDVTNSNEKYIDMESYDDPESWKESVISNKKENDDERINRQNRAKRNQYIRFVIEREITRSRIPLKEAMKQPDYKYLLEGVKGNETYKAFNIETKELIAYEEFLRDRALDNVFNPYKMFVQEKTNVAETFRRIYRNNKEALSQYPVIEALTTETAEGSSIKNLRLRNTQLDKKQINLYHENLKELADKGKMKVANKEDNDFISDFFSRLTLYGYIQAGLNHKGRFSLNKILPTDTFTDFMTGKIKPYEQYLATDKSDLSFFELYYERFIKAETVARTRDGGFAKYKPYYEPFNIQYLKALDKRKDTKKLLIPESEKAQVRVYTDIYGMSYFKSQIPTGEAPFRYYQRIASIDNATARGKKLIFIHNSLTDPDYARNVGLKNDVQFAATGVTNAIGIPTYMNDRMKLVEVKDDKDENGKPIPNKEMKALIDNAVQTLQKIKDENKEDVVFIWNDKGYGSQSLAVSAKETYFYLTEQLAKFGYANPGAKLYMKSIENLEEYYQTPMTYEEAAEIYKKCITR